MLTKLWKIIDESGFFKKGVIRNWKKKTQSEMKNSVSEIKKKKTHTH